MNRLRSPRIAFYNLLLLKNNFHFNLYFIPSIELRNMTSFIANEVDEYNTFIVRLLWWLQLKKMWKCICLLLKTIILIYQLCYILAVIAYKQQIAFLLFIFLFVCSVHVMFNVLTRKNTMGLEHNKKMGLGAIGTHMQTVLTSSILSSILSQKTTMSSVCLKSRMCFPFMLILIFQVLSVERSLYYALHYFFTMSSIFAAICLFYHSCSKVLLICLL